jgi:hypothetical protein
MTSDRDPHHRPRATLGARIVGPGHIVVAGIDFIVTTEWEPRNFREVIAAALKEAGVSHTLYDTMVLSWALRRSMDLGG